MHFLLTHGHYSIFFIPAYSLPSPRVREGPDWARFVDACTFLLSGGCQIHTAKPLVLYFTSSSPKMVDLRSIVGSQQYRDIRKR
jgi:hypothetical protein